MKNLNQLSFTTTLMMALFTTTAFAQGGGNSVGNGGLVHVCRDAKTNKILSSELLDIRRGKKLGFKFNNDEDFGYWIAKGMTRLAPYRSEYLAVAEGVEGLYSEGIPIIFLEEGSLVWTGDGSPGEADPGCQFEQIAVLMKDQLYVNQSLYRSLSKRDQAALWFHEAIYRYARKQQGTFTSEESQKLVGTLLAENSSPSQIYTQTKATLIQLDDVQGFNKWPWKTTKSRVILDEQPISIKLSARRSFGPLGNCQVYLPLGNRKIEWVTIKMSDVLYEKTFQYESTLPFMPSAMLGKNRSEHVYFLDCNDLEIEIEIIQNNQIKGYWSRSLRGLSDLEKGVELFKVR